MSATTDRRIKFLSRDLPFPTDPTFREYRMIEDLTKVTADQIMTGQAGMWMLPILAIIATMRANKNATREQLDRLLDLGPHQIEVTGLDVEDETAAPLEETETGTLSTDETLSQSGTQDSPITSQAQPVSPTI